MCKEHFTFFSNIFASKPPTYDTLRISAKHDHQNVEWYNETKNIVPNEMAKKCIDGKFLLRKEDLNIHPFVFRKMWVNKLAFLCLQFSFHIFLGQIFKKLWCLKALKIRFFYKTNGISKNHSRASLIFNRFFFIKHHKNIQFERCNSNASEEYMYIRYSKIFLTKWSDIL